jgi:hypothetical protein
VSLVNLKPHEEHMGVAKKPQKVAKKSHEVRMGVVFFAPPEQKATLFSSNRNLVGVAKKPQERHMGVAKKPHEVRMGVAKKPHEERMRLQLHYSTVNDVRLNTVYFIGKYGESCFFPVFPDLHCNCGFSAYRAGKAMAVISKAGLALFDGPA